MIKGSRKRRIAAGSGTQVQEVNRLLKQFTQMQKMMKKAKGKRGAGTDDGADERCYAGHRQSVCPLKMATGFGFQRIQTMLKLTGLTDFLRGIIKW